MRPVPFAKDVAAGHVAVLDGGRLEVGQYARELSPSEQCLQWNGDHEHQRMAGQARARQFTRDYQVQAGCRSFSAYSARWRASQGLAPLSADAVVRHVTIEDIHGPLGKELPAVLRAEIYQAWCSGRLVGVDTWLQMDQ